MLHLAVVLTVIYSAFVHGNSFLHECAKFYKPKNYLDALPHLNMPYVERLRIPNNQIIRKEEYLGNIQHIQPSSVITTKVVAIKTKYVYKNPVCVKYSKKQKFCQPQDIKAKQNVEKLVTKDFFVKNSKNIEKRLETLDSEENDIGSGQFNLKVSFNNLESSEHEQSDESRSFKNPIALSSMETPPLSPGKINEILIEDRLDQLETILPEYTRKRVYETKTFYITKTISNRRSMATLLVKNCVPLGYDICPKKTRSKQKKRYSKVAKSTLNPRERGFYYG